MELRFRQAEDMATRDPAAAHEILGDIVTRFPGSFWAGEARGRLDALGTPADARA